MSGRYSRVAGSEASLPQPASSVPTTTFGRARARWVLIAASVLSFILLIAIINRVESGDTLQAKLGSLGHHLSDKISGTPPLLYNGKNTPGWQQAGSNDAWLKGSGRQGLNMSTPFNQDDLTYTEDECEAFFPGLYKEIDRSVEYYTRHPFTKEYLEQSCEDDNFAHARVVIWQNRLYLKSYHQSDFSRSQGALGLLHLAIMTSREKLPNVEFCINMQDWGNKGKFSLSRSDDDRGLDVWLMPDYGWFSWPEHVGPYQEYRETAAKIEAEVPWEQKHKKLFWRGSMKVGTDDRVALVAATKGHEWNDVLGFDWADPNAPRISMVDHCRHKFHGFPEGNTYSGRLRYLQNCRVVIVTHEPRWLQHWTHLYNADWNSPDQNIVFVPRASGAKGGWGDDGSKQREEYYRDSWKRLPETMDRLYKDDARAKLIADNQWKFFRERYISPASATCYWRKAIKGFASTQQYSVDLSGHETSYESFVMIGGMRTWQHRKRNEEEL